VRFSRFHQPGTPLALPFAPDEYRWARPFTLKMSDYDLRIGADLRKGHYRRGVRKYDNLARGRRLPPVVLRCREAWGWTMQGVAHVVESQRVRRLRVNQTDLMAPRPEGATLLVGAMLARQMRNQMVGTQIAPLPQESGTTARWLVDGFVLHDPPCAG
jgi:hypothetical protein